MNILQTLVRKIENAELLTEHRNVSRNDFLVVEGMRDTAVYFVTQGTFRIYIKDGDDEHTTRFAYMGDVIAALDSFITGNPTSLNIQALKKAEVRAMSRDAFMTFLEADPEGKRLWVQILEQLIYTQMQREHDILVSSPAERYRRVMERSPRLFQEVPHKYIASYLRMTPETLSRIKKS